MRFLRLDFRPGLPLYVALFGGFQVAVLWLLRDRFGIVIPLLATAFLLLMAAVLRLKERWRWKAAALWLFIALTTVGPVLVSMQTRGRRAGGSPDPVLDRLIGRFFRAGHNDVCWLAMLLGGLALLARRHPVGSLVSSTTVTWA